MAGALDGIKVVEMGVWVAGPSCGAILADWGADVVKIEPPTGDPMRGAGGGMPINPIFELDNRGKRSVALNLDRSEARQVALRLLDDADVFVSNMRPRALEKYGLDYGSLASRNPRIVYCDVTGYGSGHAESNRAALDVGAAYARAGIAMSLTAPNASDPPMPRGGMIDHMAGMTAAGGISAALFRRERGGQGQRVSVALLRVGAYFMGWDLNSYLRLGAPVVTLDRYHMPNPLTNVYKDRDGRRFWLLMLQGDRHWPIMTQVLGAPELATDPRFGTLADRMTNCTAAIAELDRLLAQRSLDEWMPIFDEHDIWYSPVNRIEDIPNDPIAGPAGLFVEVQSPEGPVRQVATPVDFSGSPAVPAGWAPELGQDTEAVLQTLGYDWDEISALKAHGAIP